MTYQVSQFLVRWQHDSLGFGDIKVLQIQNKVKKIKKNRFLMCDAKITR